MTGDNKKYGRLISDGQFIQDVIFNMQDEIIKSMREEENYSPDSMKGVIMDNLDEMGVYPEDIDYVFSELNF